VVHAGSESGVAYGQRVFVPGAACFGEVRGLFGGAASRLVVPGSRAIVIDEDLGERGTLLALAATAWHAIERGSALPDLVVGHGVLGRLIARLITTRGGSPVVWETDPERRSGALGYDVVDPEHDDCRGYDTICDVSGDVGLIDALVARLARGGELVLAGFYTEPLSIAFPPAFMREARISIAAEWQPPDLAAVQQLVATRALSLEGLITHRTDASQADHAYRTAFSDARCLKMILDWRSINE
jgi:3-hydroxyethyl bacteriochlorophyllide a dehydrogenase